MKQPVGKFPQRGRNQVFDPAFFKRLVGMEGAKPLPRPPQRAKSPNDTQKIRKGRPDSPVGCRAEGNPIKGGPAGRSPAKNAQTKPAPARRNVQTLRLAGAGFRFGWIRGVSCRNFCEIAAAGTSAGGLRAAFPYFWVAPEAQRGWISLSAESEEGALPLPSLPAFFQKAGPKT